MTGTELKRIREELGWTQSRIANEIGVTANTMARWERGEIKIYEPAARLIGFVSQGRKKELITAPFDRFVQDSLKDFLQNVKEEGLKKSVSDRQVSGAREFANYLQGKFLKTRLQTKKMK